MVYEEPEQWADFISLVSWAYRTSKRTSTQGTPFFFVYVVERMVSIKVMVPSACLALTNKVLDSHSHIHNVQTLEEKSQNAESRWSTTKGRSVKPTTN